MPKTISEATIRQNLKLYVRKLESEMAVMGEKVRQLKHLLAEFGGGSSVSNGRAASKAVKTKGKRRGRRTPEQLKAHAEEIIAAIKAKGAAGASAADLAKFDYGVSLKEFLKKYGHAAKSTGKSSAMRYFVK
jgi:hypothetical protein